MCGLHHAQHAMGVMGTQVASAIMSRGLRAPTARLTAHPTIEDPAHLGPEASSSTFAACPGINYRGSGAPAGIDAYAATETR